MVSGFDRSYPGVVAGRSCPFLVEVHRFISATVPAAVIPKTERLAGFFERVLINNQRTLQKGDDFNPAGIFVFVFLCGGPALELNGFGFGIPFTLQNALICSILGGAVGGLMLCSKPILAGLVGGLVAGPAGLLAVYYYTRFRVQISNVELVLVQGVACLPGVGLCLLLKRAFSSPEDAAPQAMEAVED